MTPIILGAICAALVAAAVAFYTVSPLRRWLKDSEIIGVARLQVIVGGGLELATQIDPNLLAPILGETWFPWYLLASGIVTELLRRYRAEDL